MAEVPEKQIKRLRTLIQDAETNLAAANELLISLLGDDERVTQIPTEEVAGKIIEGEFRPGGTEREWVDPDVLRALRRRSLARLRS